jgi:hypothetical protein
MEREPAAERSCGFSRPRLPLYMTASTVAPFHASFDSWLFVFARRYNLAIAGSTLLGLTSPHRRHVLGSTYQGFGTGTWRERPVAATTKPP